ncbi:hypothetical protein AAU01_35900 [Paenarthrobacter aurescens]|uniref:Uncharacterized protein n=1 Tax=Paenarthrobacter aurescens TaxID=43663 RepID=A0A4Y3NK60_PAEAU|nr:hypothetical protein AAU01_35900 [Paenarthrobacter aurescens]
MGDAIACGHDVQLAWLDNHIAAYAIAVPDRSFQGPGDGLKAAMGVGEYAHGHTIRAEAIQEAPGAHGGQSPLGKRADHVHGAHTAQGNLALGPQLNTGTLTFRGRGADFLCGGSIKIGHAIITCA